MKQKNAKTCSYMNESITEKWRISNIVNIVNQ